MNRFLFFFSIMFSATVSQAQFGAKAGLNVSTIGGDATGIEPKAGFHVAVFWQMMPGYHIAITPELVFSRQGTQMAPDGDIRMHYDYLNLPVMFSFYGTDIFFVQAGPQFGVLVGAKASWRDGTAENIRDELNGVDVGVAVGVGADLPSSLTFSARYYAGITDTSRSQEGKFPNRVFQFAIGYRF